MQAARVHIYEFGEYRLDTAKRILRHLDGTPVPLTPRVFETLLYMVEHHDAVLDKEQIMEAIWPDSIVEENNLAQAISKLRQVFGEKPGSHTYIVTVPGRGYRFVAEVGKRTADLAAPANVEENREDSVKSIAVLPFKPLTPDNRDPILEMGMADSLIAKLSNSREIIVPSVASIRKYGRLDQDPLAAGRELKVSSVLEGNIQKSGSRIRITARLINVVDGSSLWADTFDEKFTDVFAVQDVISQKVIDALALRLSRKEQQRLTKRYTENIESYELYFTGRYHYAKLTPPDIRTSIGFYQQAIDLDPNYALAHFGLADANLSLAFSADVPSSDCLPQAKAAAMKALEIDESLAEAHASLAFSVASFDWDWTGAEREAKRAIALNPYSGIAHFAYAHVLSDLAHHDEAALESGHAIALEPVFPLFRALGAMFLHHAGRNEEAYATLQKALEFEPNFWITHLTLGKVLVQQRKYAEALAAFEKAKELSHGNSEAIASIGYVAALAGDVSKARAVVDKLKSLSNQQYIPPHNVAMVYHALGNGNQALSELGRACQERDVRLRLLKVDPRWDSFRFNPRFMAVLKRIGLQ